MKRFIKKHWTLLLTVVAFPVGNRVFNHVHPWLGIAIIITALIYIIYKLIKFLKDEKID